MVKLVMHLSCPLCSESSSDLQAELSDVNGQLGQMQAQLLDAQSKVASHRKELDAANEMCEQHKVLLSSLLRSAHQVVYASAHCALKACLMCRLRCLM